MELRLRTTMPSEGYESQRRRRGRFRISSSSRQRKCRLRGATSSRMGSRQQSRVTSLPSKRSSRLSRKAEFPSQRIRIVSGPASAKTPRYPRESLEVRLNPTEVRVLSGPQHENRLRTIIHDDDLARLHRQNHGVELLLQLGRRGLRRADENREHRDERVRGSALGNRPREILPASADEDRAMDALYG